MSTKLSKGDVNMIGNSLIELVHKRLGHMSEKEPQILAKKQLLPDMKGTPLKTYTDCLVSKQHEVAFYRNSPTRKSHVLDLIHTYVC